MPKHRTTNVSVIRLCDHKRQSTKRAIRSSQPNLESISSRLLSNGGQCHTTKTRLETLRYSCSRLSKLSLHITHPLLQVDEAKVVEEKQEKGKAHSGTVTPCSNQDWRWHESRLLASIDEEAKSLDNFLQKGTTEPQETLPRFFFSF